jgi:hypothetical protein
MGFERVRRPCFRKAKRRCDVLPEVSPSAIWRKVLVSAPNKPPVKERL